MSKNLFPAPVQTPVLEGTMFSMPWMRYLKALGDDLLMANMPIQPTTEAIQSTPTQAYKPKAVLVPGFNYVLTGSLCYCNYYLLVPVTTDVVITLPYENSLPFKFNSTVVLQGTKEITIPANTSFIDWTYAVDFKMNGDKKLV